ncbi:MAG: type II 3-dehydroquinate dehydratase [Gammaproteobacteria bacterium]|nr:type II 3-dehydroquinate dehydratase [Gammaproteobacteria bacterium]
MAKILLMNGPNLNLLGEREPSVYGHTTLEDIVGMCREMAEKAGHSLEDFQSNAEHELVERVQAAMKDGTDAILINPAAFTHTSVALRDALAAVGLPFYEIHISNPHRREPFRRHSYFSDLAEAVICGFGVKGYAFALDEAIDRLEAASGNSKTA